MRKSSLFNLFTLAFVAFILGATGVVAQNLTGDWTANTRESYGPKHKSHDGDEEDAKAADPNKIHLSFNRTSPNGGKNQHGSSFSYSDLEGAKQS